MSERKTLFLVSTPLHVFNAAEMISTERFGESDVLIISSIAGRYSCMFNCLDAKGAVTKVIEKHYFTKEVSNFFTNASFFLRLTLRRLLKMEDPLLQELSPSGYTDMVLYSPSAVALYARSLFPTARLHYGEEGIGTYNGMIFNRTFYIGEDAKHCGSKKKAIVAAIIAIMFGEELSMVPETIYLHEPSMAVDELPAKVESLSGDREMLRRYYVEHCLDGAHESNAHYPEITVLGQPYEDFGEVFSKVFSILRASDCLWVYRRHPREKRTFDRSVPQSNDGIWEIKCLLDIVDSSTLLSINSSAMMMPKLLTGAEPTLIFMYRLPGVHASIWEVSDQLVYKLKAIYREPSRIYVPTSFEELQRELSVVLSHSENHANRRGDDER